MKQKRSISNSLAVKFILTIFFSVNWLNAHAQQNTYSDQKNPGVVLRRDLPESILSTYNKMLLAAKQKDIETLKRISMISDEFITNEGIISKKDLPKYWSNLTDTEQLLLRRTIILYEGDAYFYGGLYKWPHWKEKPLKQIKKSETAIIIKLIGVDQFKQMKSLFEYYNGPEILIDSAGKWVGYTTSGD